MPLLKNREVTINKLLHEGAVRVSVTNNQDGTVQIVNLSELRFTEEEKKDFEKKNIIGVNLVSEQELKEHKTTKEAAKAAKEKSEQVKHPVKVEQPKLSEHQQKHVNTATQPVAVTAKK